MLLRDTDRSLARLIGALLAEAGASSALFADAQSSPSRLKQVAESCRPPIRMTSAGAGPYRTVVIEPLADRKKSPE